MRELIASAILLCLFLIPAHARSGPDCLVVYGVSGPECVAQSSAAARPGKRERRTVSVAGKRFTPSPVKSWNSDAAPWLADAQRYVGHRNPTARRNLWCARFINDRLASSGRRGTGSDAAKSFLAMQRTSARPGAIAVYHRKGGGHAAIVKEVSGNTVTLISGNCGRRGVCEYTRTVGSAIAYVWPGA